MSDSFRAIALTTIMLLSAVVGAGSLVGATDSTDAAAAVGNTPTETPAPTPTETTAQTPTRTETSTPTPTETTTPTETPSETTSSTTVPTSPKFSEGLQDRLSVILDQPHVERQVSVESANRTTETTVNRGVFPADRDISVLIQTRSQEFSQAVSTVQSIGDVRFTFEEQQLIAADVPAYQFGKLKQSSVIEQVSLDQAVKKTSEPTPDDVTAPSESQSVSNSKLDSWGTEYIDAGLVHESGINGSNVTVAVLDDGIDPHAGMQGKIIAEEDLAPNSQIDGDDPTDYTGHGSNVAGIIASSETTVKLPTSSSDDTRRIKGVAPGVSLLNGKIGTFNDQLSNDPDAFRRIGGLTQGQTENLSIDIPDGISDNRGGGIWLRVDATWNSPSSDVSLELIGENGQTISTLQDISGLSHPVETTVSEDTKTRIEVNGTSRLFTNTSGVTNITAVRVHGDSISGSDTVDIEVSLYDPGYSRLSNTAAGIYWASGTNTLNPSVSPPPSPSNTADVISLSYSTGRVDTPLNPIPEAMDSAVDNGTVFVTSAGNGATRNNRVETTSIKSKTSIITVGAVDDSGFRAPFSQVGDDADDKFKPDVVAPGTNIPSAGPTTRIPRVNGQYNGTELSGTSQATPHVTGVAALYIQMYKRTHGEPPTPQQVRSAIIAGTTDRRVSGEPLNREFTNETGMGIVNAYNTYLTFSFAGDNSGETDDVSVSAPPSLPENRITADGLDPRLTGTFYRQDQGDPFEVTLDGSAATEYGPIAVAETQLTPSETNRFSISRQSGGGLTDTSEEWALATHYPPIGQTIEDDQVDGYNFRGPINLDAGESAAYVVPVEESFSGSFIDNRGGIRAISYYDSSLGDVDIRATLPQQGTIRSGINTSRINTEQIVTPPPTDSSKVVFAADGTSGTQTFAHASNYPLFPLPAEADATVTDDTAGNASDPGQVEVDVQIESGGPYIYHGFDAPDASHFDVMIGNQKVPSSAITVTEQRQDLYSLRFTAPKQPSTGNFNLTVAFTDEKLNVSHTAKTSVEDAIGYSGEGSSGSAAVSLIIDASGSMSSGQGSKLRNAKQASEIFVADQLSDDEYAAIVGYGVTAANSSEMKPVGNNRTTLNQSIYGVENVVSGYSTNIGEGLILGRQNLDKAPDGTSKAAVILTDGLRNTGPSEDEIVNTIAPVYDNKGYEIYSVAYGAPPRSEQLLKDTANVTADTENISTSPEKRFYNEPGSGDIRDIYRSIRELVSGTSTLQTASGTVDPGTATQNSVSIDDSTDSSVISVTTNDLTQQIQSDSASQQTQNGGGTKLYDPNQRLVERNQSTATGTNRSDVEYSKTGNTETYRLTDPEPGNWSYEIENQQTDAISYDASVTGSTSTTLGVATDAQEYANGSTAKLTATLLGSSGGLTGATVNASITKPDGSTMTIPLTEESAGKYVAKLDLTDNGMYSATVTAADGQIARTEETTWTVIDKSSVYQVTRKNKTHELNTSVGGSVTVELNAKRPSRTTLSSITSSSSSSTTDSPTETSELSDFESRARELATLSRSEIRTVNVSEPLRQAALTIKDTREGADGSAVIEADTVSTSGSSSSQGSSVFVSTTDLEGPGSASISTGRVSVDPQSYVAIAGSDRTVTVEVDVPRGIPTGTYTGNVTFAVDGVIVEQQIDLTVTEASTDVYVTRIRQAATNWEAASPAGKQYYEDRIADHLTDAYFGSNSSASSSTASGSPVTEDEARTEEGA